MGIDSALSAVYLSRDSAFNALRWAQTPLKISHMSVGANIRRARKAKGLTLEQVVAEFGSDTGNLSRIERDQQELTSGKLMELARILGVHVTEFFAEAGRKPATISNQNVEPYEVGQQTIERMQLLADFEVLPVDLQAMVAKKASDYRAYFEGLPAGVRKYFAKPGDPNTQTGWERSIEADIAKLQHLDPAPFSLEEARAKMADAPAPVRRVAEHAQKELDKHNAKDGPRWVFVLVPEEEGK